MGILKLELTNRDVKILNILDKIPHLREDLLAKYLMLDYNSSSTKSVLHQLSSRLKKHKIVNRQKIFNGGYFYWSLDISGANLTNSIIPKNLSLLTFNHDDIVAEIVINKLNQDSNIEIQTEYEIKKTLYGKEAREKKLPDIIVNDNIAIEVELSSKNNRRNINLINSYINSNFDEILYYSNDKKILNKLSKLIKNSLKFKFYLFESNINNAIEIENKLENKDDFSRNNINGRFTNKNENLLKELNII